ncbi:unnamed protein product [Cuscuta epithymum]|uniref:Uncharacterized protein n=1 Tax=Cuscuta epithymum TaxID=186058 RepID=A0AAV0DVJ9_9ASTE|nr:unnamed protein product [Cuscuta epithymum]
MGAILTFSSSGTFAALKYSSISHRKFSNSLALRSPPKVFGSGTLIFEEPTSALGTSPAARALFKITSFDFVASFSAERASSSFTRSALEASSALSRAHTGLSASSISPRTSTSAVSTPWSPADESRSSTWL